MGKKENKRMTVMSSMIQLIELKTFHFYNHELFTI